MTGLPPFRGPTSGRINRPLAWMGRALQLGGKDTPADLDLSRVLPVMEVFNGGWPHADWNASVLTVAAAQPAGELDLLAPDRHSVGILTAAEIIRVAGGAAANVRLELRNENSSVQVSLFNPAIAVGGRLGTAELLGSVHARFYVPPRWRLVWVFPATAAGETWTFKAAVATMPLGGDFG